MNRIYKYILSFLLPVVAVSCNDISIEIEPVVNDSIILSFGNGRHTKAQEADTDIEATVSFVDVMIFDEEGTSKVHHERVNVNGVESGSFALSKVKSDFTENAAYQVYLVANSIKPAADFGAVKTVNELKLMTQEDPQLLFTGTGGTNPEYFLMDAVAYTGTNEPAAPGTVIINDGVSTETTVLKATFRRAAAKIEVVIRKGNDVTFLRDNSNIPQYYLRRYSYSTLLIASDIEYDPDTRNSEVSLMSDAEWTADIINLKAYTYAYEWEGESAYENETSVVVNIPLIYNGETKSENWYKIPVSKNSILMRNHYYRIEVTINAPGGSRLDPEEALDFEIRYEAAPWENVDITLGGETNRPKFLQLNTNHVDMYNVNEDLETLEFASSSEIQNITLDEAYYYDYLDNRINLASNDKYNVYDDISAVADPGVLNGGISIYSPFVEKTDKEITDQLGFAPEVQAIPPKPAEPVDRPDIDQFINNLNNSSNNYVYRAVKGTNNQIDVDELNYTIQRKRRNQNNNEYRTNNDANNEWIQLVKEFQPWADYTEEQLQAAKDEYQDKLAEYNAALAAHEVLDEYIAQYNALKGEKHSNAIRYMTFTVTNADGISTTFTVAQYPTLYITNEHGRYSYRDDFNGTTYESPGTGENRNGAAGYDAATGTWSYYHDNNYGGRLFQSKVYDESDGYVDYYYWDGNRVINVNEHGHDLRNPRMYHVHVTATSSRYTVAVPRLDADGYTESSEDNSHLVSPSFMIASQLGATLSPTSVEEAKSHCSQYVEVTKATDRTPKIIYDDWRLPTAAEVDIIIQHQYESDAMAEVLAGNRYWCAFTLDGSYSVENTRSTSSSTTIAVRCVRDEL